MKQTLANTANRIHVLDIIRGIAVLGICTMNIPEMALPLDLMEAYSIAGPDSGWSYWIGVISEILFSDKMRGLFTLLFGVSSILIMERLENNKLSRWNAADIYFRRLIWLVVLGMVDAYFFLWSGDVLFQYAILGMFLFPFRKAPRQVLVAAILTCLVILTIQPINYYRDMVELQEEYTSVMDKQQSGEELTWDDEEILEEWEESIADLQPDEEDIADEIEAKTGSYLDVFEYNAEEAVEAQSIWFYTEDFLEMILYMFLGMLLYKIGFFARNVKQAVHLIVAVLGIGVGLVVYSWTTLGLVENFSHPVDAEYYWIFTELGRLPFVLGYTSLIILLFRANFFQRMGAWLAATGKMALTNYLMHSIIGAFLFYGFGLAQFNQFNRVEITITILAIWIFQVIFSSVWMQYCHYGPFEWVWRSLTYWKVQPFWKVQPTEGALMEPGSQQKAESRALG